MADKCSNERSPTRADVDSLQWIWLWAKLSTESKGFPALYILTPIQGSRLRCSLLGSGIPRSLPSLNLQITV